MKDLLRFRLDVIACEDVKVHADCFSKGRDVGDWLWVQVLF